MNIDANEDVEQQELLYIAHGNAKWYRHFRRQLDGFLQNNTLTMQSSSYAPGYLTKRTENLCARKYLHADVYSSFVHNCQNLETTKMSFSRCMHK